MTTGNLASTSFGGVLTAGRRMPVYNKANICLTVQVSLNTKIYFAEHSRLKAKSKLSCKALRKRRMFMTSRLSITITHARENYNNRSRKMLCHQIGMMHFSSEKNPISKGALSAVSKVVRSRSNCILPRLKSKVVSMTIFGANAWTFTCVTVVYSFVQVLAPNIVIDVTFY